MLSYTFMGIADTFMVARIGTTEIAAVGLGMTATFTLTCFGLGLLNAVKVVASQAFGAGNPARSREAAYQGMFIAVVTGLVVLGLTPLSGPILALMGARNGVMVMGAEYFQLRLLGVLPMFLSIAAFGYFQGLGDTRTPMRITVVANLVNVGLDVVLIFGLGPFPEMGTTGAAVATAVAFGLQGGAAVLVLVRSGRTLDFQRRPFRLKGSRELLRLGLPMGMQWFLEVIGWAAFAGFVARQGEVHLAAHTIAIRVISVSFLVGHGIGEGASILTGQAVGARQEGVARRVARRATYLCLGVMGACGLAFVFFGTQIIGFFRPGPEVLDTAVSLLLIAAAFQLFDAVVVVKTGVLNGAGDTRFVMFVGVAIAWTILVPFGYLLCNGAGYGAPGAWWAILLELLVLAAVLAWRWERRSPLRKAIDAA
jgi:MATE family multidrug resistance protein